MHWIARNKLYEGYGVWYCHMCGHRTPTEINPEWIADGSPRTWIGDKYSWFARCAHCGYEKHPNTYGCPHCGKPLDDEQPPLNKIEPKYNAYYSYEFGVTGYDWEENHRCTTCGRRFWISNSSC